MKASWFLDAFFMAGFVLMAMGLYLWSAPLMLVVMGAILMGLALVGAWRGKT
jgi:hypothetical protein